jgi:acyl-CoA reductase-like NAD-dependent aldehyde dehydrogenase
MEGPSDIQYGSDRRKIASASARKRKGIQPVVVPLSSTYAPFGGIKASGLGHERGVEGMRMFQRLVVYSVTR